MVSANVQYGVITESGKEEGQGGINGLDSEVNSDQVKIMIETENSSSEKSLLNLPPPPPLPNFLFERKPVEDVNSSRDFQEDEFESFGKAIKRVTEADDFLHAEPFHSNYTRLKSQLQEGPKCGLVALSIATSTTDYFQSADKLFGEALSQGYTTQGEMYSCQNLADLTEKTTNFKTLVIEGGIDSHLECIFHCIENGGLMLVPYDADFNHSPCCRGGRSAHWAVMSGIVVFRLKEVSGSEEEKAVEIYRKGVPGCDCSEKEIFADFPIGNDKVRVIGSYVIKDRETRMGSVSGKIYLAGKQGKSRHLSLWPFDQLAESNSNLRDLSEEQKVKNFVLPRGGVEAGLNGKAVLLIPEAKK